MRATVTILCFVCVAGAAGVAAKSLPLPPYITPCSRNVVDLDACALKNGREAIPKFINGDRKYKIPALDPLEISEVHVDSGVLGLNFSATEVKIHGIPGAILEKVMWGRPNVKKVGQYIITFPRIEVEAQYMISGRILILPITGNGRANLTFENIRVNYTFDYDLVDRDGVVFFLPLRTKLQFEPSKMYVTLENLFNGNKLLGDQTNRFMNENWRDVLKELGPVFGDTIGEVMRRIQYNIFELVDYDTAFPNN